MFCCTERLRESWAAFSVPVLQQWSDLLPSVEPILCLPCSAPFAQVAGWDWSLHPSRAVVPFLSIPLTCPLGPSLLPLPHSRCLCWFSSGEDCLKCER